ncbi:hypothetical protein [Halorhabdus sp. CBA1104]|uniref:hypothetical protein n=1 Tax=Halorhabdus sp. CBA1104 TaxID=1380432 RepID=UPI0012B3A19B|nr:hypothetical protein [Halorhabdus sp. CBA1104]
MPDDTGDNGDKTDRGGDESTGGPSDSHNRHEQHGGHREQPEQGRHGQGQPGEQPGRDRPQNQPPRDQPQGQPPQGGHSQGQPNQGRQPQGQGGQPQGARQPQGRPSQAQPEQGRDPRNQPQGGRQPQQGGQPRQGGQPQGGRQPQQGGQPQRGRQQGGQPRQNQAQGQPRGQPQQGQRGPPPGRGGQPGGPPQGGGGSWLPSGFQWTPLTILAILVIVGGAAAAGVFVATGGDVPFLSDGADSSSPALDTVPEDVDMVMYMDSGIVDDQTTETMVDGALEMSAQNPYYSGPTSYSDMLEQVKSESPLDVDGFHSATMFARYPDTQTGMAQYVGFIVKTDWSETDLISTIEETAGTGTLEEQSYAETTVYVQSQSYGPDTWVAAMGDGTFVIGYEGTVKDAIDVENGDAEAFSGDLRQSFENLRDGYVKFSSTMPAQATQQASQMPQGAQIVRNVETMSGVYYTSGSDVGVEMQVTATDQSSAETVTEAVKGLKSLATMGSQSSEISELVDQLEVTQDQRRASMSFQYPASDLVDVMQRLAGTSGLMG